MKTFEEYFEQFKKSAAWKSMQETIEDSPWHREDNVAVHTQMCLNKYDTIKFPRTDRDCLVAKIAILFHDVGKPEAEQIKDKKDGSGKYRQYAGHEQNSALAFMETYVSCKGLQSLLTPEQARAVRWIIEHHLPYSLKDEKKRQSLAVGTYYCLENAGVSYETFFDVLRSDSAGRISDDHETKLKAVNDWILDFKSINTHALQQPLLQPLSAASPRVFILVGPSGSGKSTWVKKHQSLKQSMFPLVISPDSMKLKYFNASGNDQILNSHAEYEAALEFCEKTDMEQFNKFFRAECLRIFKEAKETGVDVFVDLVNANRKTRVNWVKLGEQFNFRIVAVEFWNRLGTLLDRQNTRPDKKVPDDIVKKQFNVITLCSLWYEVHGVLTIIGE
jgi:predicted kinase